MAIQFGTRTLAIFGSGIVTGALLSFAYGRFGTNYWRRPGWFQGKTPRLHAWTVRLMKNGGPGRDGMVDYQVPESEWPARGGTLDTCFAAGFNQMVIQYSKAGDTLAGVYRCQIGNMVGELQVAFVGPWDISGVETAYMFRTLDPATAPPIEPFSLMDR